LRFVGGDLGSGFFAGTQPDLQFGAAALALFFALGLAAAIIGAWVPARDAARTAPAFALKAGAEEDALKPLGRVAPGVALLALAALVVWCATGQRHSGRRLCRDRGDPDRHDRAAAARGAGGICAGGCASGARGA
jgi:hypothetical protein